MDLSKCTRVGMVSESYSVAGFSNNSHMLASWLPKRLYYQSIIRWHDSAHR